MLSRSFKLSLFGVPVVAIAWRVPAIPAAPAVSDVGPVPFPAESDPDGRYAIARLNEFGRIEQLIACSMDHDGAQDLLADMERHDDSSGCTIVSQSRVEEALRSHFVSSPVTTSLRKVSA